MDKRNLAKIPVIEASPYTLKIASKSRAKDIVEARICGEKNELLTLYIFNKDKLLKGNTKAEVRMFIDEVDYITQDLKSQKVKWYTGTFNHILNGYYYGWNCGYEETLSKESLMMIETFFDKDIDKTDPYRLIFEFQNKVLDERLALKHLKITKPIDDLMATVPEIPKDFEEWVENQALIKSRYIYYQYTGKVNVTGYCTHCKKEVKLYKPKHDLQVKCPNCNSDVLLKSIGKSKHIEDKTDVLLLQKMQTGFIARYFNITKRYHSQYRNPELNCYERKRDFFDENLKTKRYEYGVFKQKNIRWKEDDSGWWRTVIVYPKNLDEVNALLPYSGVSLLANHDPDYKFYFDKLISDCQNNHIAEKLAKVGLFRLAQDYLQPEFYGYTSPVNKKGKTLNELLEVKNDDSNLLIRADVNSEELSLFKHFRKLGKRISVEQLAMFRKNDIAGAELKEISRYVSFSKAIKYLDSLHIKEKDILYRDYLHTCNELKYDLKNEFIAFPKNLKERHDQNVETINEIKWAKERKTANSKYAKIAQRKDKLNDYYAFENNSFFISAPENAGEIITEGHILHHCVGGSGYLGNIANGNTAILFLRDKKAPNKPYYTIEIKGNVLIQCHTFGNKDKDKSRIQSFLKTWQKFLDGKTAKEVPNYRKVV